MNTFKTIVVVGTLLSVGYGAHVIMNKPISNEPLDIADRVWDDITITRPEVDLSPDLPTALVPDLPQLGTSDPTAAPAHATAANVSFNPPPVPAGSASSEPGEIAPTARETPQPPLAMMPPPGNLAPVPPDPNASPSVVDTPPPPLPTSTAAFPEQTATAHESTNTPEPSPAGPTAPASPEYSSTWSNGFEEMWESVQLKLQSSQYVDALLATSLFYNDQGLTGEQRDRMILLLDQLAGTVIYSPDYHMEPAYVVRADDTLAQIASAYKVPVTLLARVNGVAEGELQPGQQLKVLRGPFRGELDVARRELTLFLGRYYAGRFSVGVGRDLPAQAATLEVAEMTGPRSYVDRRTGQEVAAGAPENPYGLYWIGLRDPGMSDYPFLGIHATGAAVDASDTRGCISVSDQDAGDLQAILSLGSTITLVR